MRPSRVLALALALALALVAGCFGADVPPNERRVSASNGTATAGWAYGGEGVVGGDATLEGVTNDAENTGAVNVTFAIDGARWAVSFDRFAQAEGKDFQDGGVAHALDEHGDTGVADATIPRIHALVAAWGSASVMREGQLVTSEPWSAHLMVSADTVRGADGRIAKADGTTPYDPASPADARRVEGDPQVIFWIKHPQGETFQRGPVVTSLTLSCATPQCSDSGEIPLDAGAVSYTINLTPRPDGQLPLAAGRNVEVIITDAAGAVFARATIGDVIAGPVPATPASLEGDIGDAPFVGPLTATLTGDGAFSVLIEATILYVDHPFLVITWDEPTVS